MNFDLTDEQRFLREAARDAVGRVATVEAAREGLESPGAFADLWPVAVEAGWTGLLIGEDDGGAGLGAFDAMLVAEELGRVLARVPFVGVLPAAALLDGTPHATAVADGTVRPVLLPGRPGDDLDPAWTADALGGGRGPLPTVDADGAVTGTVANVVDAPGAGLLVVVASNAAGTPVAVAVPADADGVTVEPVVRYDATRELAHVVLEGATGSVLSADSAALADAWFLAQALLAAEAVGAAQTCLDAATQYAKERFTFGRPIGSYQAVKHDLAEVLRHVENARALLFYAGFARDQRPDEWPLSASAARAAAGAALDLAARSNIATHGGIGATWEHDAPLFFRRAQLSRRLLGGHGDAKQRVASELLREAAALSTA